MPRNIRQGVNSKVAMKRKLNNVLTGVGCVNDVALDFDKDAHEPRHKKMKISEETLSALKEVWEKEYERKRNHN